MRVIVLLGIAVLMSGCIKTFNTSDGQSRLIKAEHRAVISAKREVIGSHGQPVLGEDGERVTSLAVCAEPSPDALFAAALELSSEDSSSEEALKALFSTKTEHIGLRTQTIQLLRDGYFRLCEAFLNDGIDSIAYDVLQRRFQSQIVALLAVEQLTQAVPAQRGSGPTEMSHIAKTLEDSERTLHNLKNKTNNKESTDDNLKEMLAEQIERREHMNNVLEKSFLQAAQAIQESDTAKPGEDSVGTAECQSAVINAVRAITLNAINQDYESQVCFETLRFHNNLGQFRNDVNNAFDSAGLATELKGGKFMEHCENLFAAQADFRDARVRTVEAFASAIQTVTSKVAYGKLSASDAAYYIRVLSTAVPTEAGTAFLRREWRNNSKIKLPNGASIENEVGLRYFSTELKLLQELIKPN